MDFRVDGIPQEAIFNDEIQMKDIKETLQKLQIGSQMQSIRDGLNKEDMIFLQRIKSRDIQHGKCGIDSTQADHIHSPMSSLLETYTRRNAAVSMRKLA